MLLTSTDPFEECHSSRHKSGPMPITFQKSYANIKIWGSSGIPMVSITFTGALNKLGNRTAPIPTQRFPLTTVHKVVFELSYCRHNSFTNSLPLPSSIAKHYFPRR